MKILNLSRYFWFLILSIVVCSFFILNKASGIFLESDIYALAASIQDDSFYYIIPAFNFAHGDGFTFGGEKTYGFQVGYELLLVFFGLFTDSPSELLRVSLLINSFLFIGTSFFIFLSVSYVVNSSNSSLISKNSAYVGGAIAAIIYLSNYWNFFNSTTGKENALAAFLLAIIIYFTLKIDKIPTPQQAFIAGILSSILLLTRPVPATLLYLLVFLWIYRKNYKIFIMSSMILPLLWSIFAKIYFGGIIPIPALIKASASSGAFGIDTIIKAWEYFLTSMQFGVFGPSKVSLPQPNYSLALRDEVSEITLYLGLFISFIAFFVYLLNAQDKPLKNKAVMIFLLLTACAVGAFLMGISIIQKNIDLLYYSSWYFYDSPVILSILFGTGVSLLIRKIIIIVNKPEYYLLITTMLFIVITQFYTISQYHKLSPYTENDFNIGVEEQRWTNVMIASGIWLMNNNDNWKSKKVAAFSSGVLGLVLEDRVINLDGLANNNAAITLLNHEPITNYIANAKPDYLIDIGVMNPTNKVISLERLHTLPFKAYNGYQISQFKYFLESKKMDDAK